MKKLSSMPINQQGVALIVVLLFLILITLAGAIAVRNSTTDLKLATSEQADTLLLNTADNTNKSIEQTINVDMSDYQAVAQKNLALSKAGMFGYFMNIGGEENRGDQIVFCYRPRANYFFRMSEATVIDPSGGSKLTTGSTSTGGFCRTSKAEDFSSARNNVMTQVAITRPTSAMVASRPFEFVDTQRTVNTKDNTSSTPNFRLYSTSFLPGLTQAKESDILECLKKPNQNAADYGFAGKDDDDNDITLYYDETMTQCLANLGVPAKTLIEDVKLENLLTAEKCLDYGKGTANNKFSDECQKMLNITEKGAPKA
ncbi:hypothetical protein ACTXLJ_01560 [Psychrobacter celer]|uniref:hypothetical protein n=1 Tax=Psychrobacter TaxID=497 RepID=UPI000EED5ECA|nr:MULTISPECIES: hypothetical protein [Psychrobacter]HCH27634.1 hypothetical protein [Psychrobacter sp.]